MTYHDETETEEIQPELLLSPLQKERLEYLPGIPDALRGLDTVDFEEGEQVTCKSFIAPSFPHLTHAKQLKIVRKEQPTRPLKIGVVLSGGQAAGGHNVITGLFDALQELNIENRVIGFLNGPGGIVRNKTLEITQELLAPYRNQGGFDLIGSGRTKIETRDQFQATLNAVQANDLDGLIIIGGDDSNTNAAFLAEYFASLACKTCVIGVPKTIDGDLQGDNIEISFGFDTACKTYSEIIGNIARDALSAKKYYYFIKLMGRSASHITLECALQTQANLALIGEEIQAKRMKLKDVVKLCTDLVVERYKSGFTHGVVLIPEGIVEFMPDVNVLITELNTLLAHGSQDSLTLDRIIDDSEKITYITARLSQESSAVYKILPRDIKLQLLLDRDPHGNVQVSKIDSERLLMQLTEAELHRIDPSIHFSCQPIFCGYEGRSGLPSNFDANYCYALGRLAAVLVARRKSGYIASFTSLTRQPEDWDPQATPLVSMLTVEEREGKPKTVIHKSLVNLKQKAFLEFSQKRASWRIKDQYCSPGPIQFAGSRDLTDSVPITLKLNRN